MPVSVERYLHAEDVRDQSAGDGHRAQPQEADDGAEEVHRERRERQRDEDRERHRPREIERGEHVLLRVAAPGPAPGEAAEDVEEPDQRQRRHAGLGRHVLVGEERREMHRDEHELEAAHEVAGAQQHVAAVAERFAQRFRYRLALDGRLPAPACPRPAPPTAAVSRGSLPRRRAALPASPSD